VGMSESCRFAEPSSTGRNCFSVKIVGLFWDLPGISILSAKERRQWHGLPVTEKCVTRVPENRRHGTVQTRPLLCRNV